MTERSEAAGAEEAATEPRGEVSIRTLAMPADVNQYGDIFGGWVLGQMDIAGGIFASTIARGRVVTVAVDAMTFKRPVFIGDVVCFYTDKLRVGTTSIAVHVEAWVIRKRDQDRISVTQGTYTYVAIDEQGRPRPVRG